MASPFANDPNAVFGNPSVAPIDAGGAQHYASQAAANMRQQVIDRRNTEAQFAHERKMMAGQAAAGAVQTGAGLANSALGRASEEGMQTQRLDFAEAQRLAERPPPGASSLDQLNMSLDYGQLGVLNSLETYGTLGGASNQLVRPSPSVGSGTIPSSFGLPPGGIP